jgi:hypothetical protein
MIGGHRRGAACGVGESEINRRFRRRRQDSGVSDPRVGICGHLSDLRLVCDGSGRIARKLTPTSIHRSRAHSYLDPSLASSLLPRSIARKLTPCSWDCGLGGVPDWDRGSVPRPLLGAVTPLVDRTEPLPLRCETALDRASSSLRQMTPSTRLCPMTAGSQGVQKNHNPR